MSLLNGFSAFTVFLAIAAIGFLFLAVSLLIEQGNGGDGDGTGGIGRVARTSPALIFGLLQQLQALGLDIPTILAQLGVNAGKQTEAVTKPVEPKAGKPLT